MIPRQQRRRGFALFIAIVFMSVMLAFGLALGALGYKQQVLASTALESQEAFYAADAGLECALYADQQQNLFAYPATAPTSIPSMSCAGSPGISPYVISYTASGWVIFTRLNLDGGKHCADVTVYKPSPTAPTPTTYVFSQGYSTSCTTVAAPNGARFSSRGINAHY